MDTINVGVLLSACIDVAQRAGNEIRKVWKSGDLGVKDKGNDDPFTKADINSQMLIMGVLHKTWPKLTMIGEENIEIPSSTLVPNLDLINLDKVPASFQKVPLSDICVFIDPLDATKEFTLGNLEAVITLIGISYKGDPVAGVMYHHLLMMKVETELQYMVCKDWVSLVSLQNTTHLILLIPLYSPQQDLTVLLK